MEIDTEQLQVYISRLNDVKQVMLANLETAQNKSVEVSTDEQVFQPDSVEDKQLTENGRNLNELAKALD